MLSFPPSPQVRIFICREPVDMRNSFDGLSGAVIDVVDHDPQSGHLFVFFNRKRSMMNAIVWDSSDYWVLSKRLDQGRFQAFDRLSEHGARFELSSSELAPLLDGIDLRSSERRQIRTDTEALLRS